MKLLTSACIAVAAVAAMHTEHCVALRTAPSVHPLVLEDLRAADMARTAATDPLEVSFMVLLREQASVRLDATMSRAAAGQALLAQLQQTAANTQPALVAQLRADPHITDVRPLYIVNALVVRCTGSGALNALLDTPLADAVEHIEPNRAFAVPLEVEDDAATSHSYPRRHVELLAMQMASAGGDTALQPAVNGTSAVQWNIDWVKAPKVWASTGSGEGTIYANADTGVAWQHESLRDNYKGRMDDGTGVQHDYNWFDGIKRPLMRGEGPCGIDSAQPCDDNGHGTHTTSTAVGTRGYGVAPGSKWIACRNMDRGLGSSETYLNCLQFFLAPTDLAGENPDPAVRPHAIGNSYGCPRSEGCARNAFSRAIAVLHAAGVFMSVSAGNEGPGCSTVDSPPGYEPLVTSVGATGKRSPKITSFSSRGPAYPLGRGADQPMVRKPDVTAPGSQIVAAYPGGSGTRYASLSGTSMASPHVGGAVLLLTQGCPCLARNVPALQQLLQDTAEHYTTGAPDTRTSACGGESGDAVPNNVYGYGGIDIERALQKCLTDCKA